MYSLAASAIEIECNMAQAYTYASNLEYFSEWFPGVIAIASGNDIPHGNPGKIYHEIVQVPLRGRRRVRITVVQAESPHLQITEGNLPALLPRMEMRFTSLGAHRCTVEWRMYSRRSNGMSRFFILPLARRIMRRRAPHGRAALKALLEGG
ncbi:SRPBCC family protein [Alcanivorax sp.]|uniref:SRPBCC family protein n=1 Tax=Alcanivorax sp. TaxID=1872427 RepID=UPI003417E121